MVQVSHISKGFRKKQVLQDVSFLALPKELVAVIGRNGTGKSTLLHILSGMQKPDGGSISYFGQEIDRKNYRRGRRIFAKYCGYVPQANGLIEELSVQDNISLWTGKSGRPSGELCEMFGLDGLLKMPVMHLSGGMKRRVAIACAMAGFPPVLLLDEPTTALDRDYRDALHAFFREYLDMNGLIIMATHDDREIAMADKTIYINEDGVGITRTKEEESYVNEFRPDDGKTLGRGSAGGAEEAFRPDDGEASGRGGAGGAEEALRPDDGEAPGRGGAGGAEETV